MRKKVLIVEDNPVLRELYETIIDLLGEEIVFAISGQDGWQKFKKNQPDLVITDLKMETSDAGFKLARKIKKISNTPVIMITGERIGDNKDLDCILSKPIHIAEFEKTVKKFLERR